MYQQYDKTPRAHTCIGSKLNEQATETWFVLDAQGIALCRVCAKCEAEKLSHYRPEILHGYTQADVDEPIEADDSGW